MGTKKKATKEVLSKEIVSKPTPQIRETIAISEACDCEELMAKNVELTKQLNESKEALALEVSINKQLNNELNQNVRQLNELIAQKDKTIGIQCQNLTAYQIKIDKLFNRGFWARVFNENVE